MEDGGRMLDGNPKPVEISSAGTEEQFKQTTLGTRSYW